MSEQSEIEAEIIARSGHRSFISVIDKPAQEKTYRVENKIEVWVTFEVDGFPRDMLALTAINWVFAQAACNALNRQEKNK